MAYPIPPALRSDIERYVQSELEAPAKYDNRRTLDAAGVAALRSLVERAYAAGYSDGYAVGHADATFAQYVLAPLLAEGGESR